MSAGTGCAARLLAAAVVTLTWGCGAMSNPPASGAAPVSLDEQARGSVVELRVGQALRITLPSNPSTGYTWRLARPELPSVLVPEGEPAYSPAGGEARVGAPGTQAFTFRALQSGRGTLRLEYVRPWQPDEVARDFSIEAVVRR